MNNSLERIIFLEFKNLKDFHSRNNNPRILILAYFYFIVQISKDFLQKSLLPLMIKNMNLRNICFKHYQINNNFKNLV